MSGVTWFMIAVYVLVFGGSSVYTMVHTLKRKESNNDDLS